MEYYNTENLNITSSMVPDDPSLFIESAAGYLYVTTAIWGWISKSENKGATWDLIVNHAGWGIVSYWHDRINDYLYFVEWNESPDELRVWYIDMSNDSVWQIGSNITPTGGWTTAVYGLDVFLYGGNVYCIVNYTTPGAIVYTKVYKYTASWSEVGSRIGTQIIGTVVIVSNIAYYLNGGGGGSVYIRGFDLTSEAFTIVHNVTIGHLLSVLRGISYDDDDTLFFLISGTPTTDRRMYRYSISGNTSSEVAPLSLYLMLNRNTAPGTLEKGYTYGGLNIYQLSGTRDSFHLIGTLPSGTVIRGITDNFVITNSGEMFEFIDYNSSVYRCDFIHEVMEASEGTMAIVKDSITISKGMFISIEGMYTSNGSSAIDVIFEGKVIDFDEKRLQKVWLESPAKMELLQRPKGDYSGRSDEIMASLIGDYCKYVSIGTLGTGSAMGTITYAGDKTLLTILTDLAKFENWIWYLNPRGQVYFNSGAVDSLVDITEANKIWKLREGNIREPYNHFVVNGAFITGVQLTKILEESDDLTSQQQFGLNPLSETYAELKTQALVDSMAGSRKSRMKLSPKIVNYFHYDPTIGYTQVGETKTFSCNKSEPIIASDQFYIHSCKFNAKKGIGDYKIADELI